ncbi:MAG TPA: GatB/YqeY domain-containing protein, partial [Thiothrix sp.]|nr:GatB/YqeY domain-containing protein [Thiothrix sp.]
MSLKQQIKDDMKTAMKAKDKARLTTVRLMLAAIKQQEVDKQ